VLYISVSTYIIYAFLSINANKYNMTSREYAKFKRLFVGPLLPRRIRKQRGILFNCPVDDLKFTIPIKPPKVKIPKPTCTRNRLYDPLIATDITDWRNSRNTLHIISVVTPIWADKKKIKEIYENSRFLSKSTGVKHHVDHIIPLRHPLVCGLHVENNLSIIPQTENSSKSNSFRIE